MADSGFDGLTLMPGYDLKSDFGFNGWQWLRWLDFDAWLRPKKWLRLQWLTVAWMAWLRCRLQATMWLRLQWELEIGFSFNGCQRLRCLDFDAWLRPIKWLRLRWLDFDAWLRPKEWLRLQWLSAALMAWLRCLATSYKVASTSMAGCGFNG